MPRVVVYGKPGCHLCEQAEQDLRRLQAEFVFEVAEVDITGDPALFDQMKHDIPVIEVDGRRLWKYRVPPRAFRKLMEEGGWRKAEG
jgi:glutaredoxin